MSKVTLNNVSDITQSTSAQTTINTNSSTIQTAFDNTVSRDGTSPNQMGANLDMNSNQILNLPAPASINSAARLQDVTNNPLILTVPPVGTSGAVVPLLNGNNTWSGGNTFSNTLTLPATVASTTTTTWTADQYFKSGAPWFDVKAFGAKGDNSTNDTVSIQNAIDAAAVFNFGLGAIVFFPPGIYKIPGGLIGKSGVRLVGTGVQSTQLFTGTDVSAIAFDSTCAHASAEQMFITGFLSNTAVNNVVSIFNGTVVNLDNCYIWGGRAGLLTGGVNCHFRNCFFAGYVYHVFSVGASWFNNCTFDTGPLAGATPTAGYAGNAYYTTGVAETYLNQCDFSGSFTNGILINDTSGTSALTGFTQCVCGSPVTITNAKWTGFSQCEMNAAVTVGNNPTSIVGCFGPSIVVSGAGKILAGNSGIT